MAWHAVTALKCVSLLHSIAQMTAMLGTYFPGIKRGCAQCATYPAAVPSIDDPAWHGCSWAAHFIRLKIAVASDLLWGDWFVVHAVLNSSGMQLHSTYTEPARNTGSAVLEPSNAVLRFYPTETRCS